MKSIIFILKFIILLLFINITIGCGDRALFDELANNRLEVRLKATYASNSPQPWDFPGVAAVTDDNSLDDYLVAGEDPTVCLIDIAELRLNSDKFANYRQEVRFALDNTCEGNSVCGDGIILENDDVLPGKNYSSLKLYLRKIIIDKTKKYQVSGSGWSLYVDDDNPEREGENWDIFFEHDVEGFNFNLRQVNTYYDALKNNSSDINRVFAYELPIVGGLNFNNNNDKTVLEVRIVINNFVKRFESDKDLNEGILVHYYAFSDWLRDVKFSEDDIGGNILGVARVYVEGQTGVITGHNDGQDSYIIVIPEEEDISKYTLSSRSRPLSGDFPTYPSLAGNYIEASLDYYLKVEEYRINWMNNLPEGDTVDEQFLNYQDVWEEYNDRLDQFSIPPLAVFSEAGTDFRVENISSGNYKVYKANKPAYGCLFYDGDFKISNEGVVAITVGSVATVTFSE